MPTNPWDDYQPPAQEVYRNPYPRQTYEMIPPPQAQQAGLSTLQKADKGLGMAREGIGLANKFGKLSSLGGKLSKATPWGIGGTAASIAGGLVGKHNYRTGGALAGAGKGAATGAMIGSVVPGIGTAIGGILGGAIGGLKGFFGGKKRKEEQHKLDLAKQAQADADNYEVLKQKYMSPGSDSNSPWL